MDVLSDSMPHQSKLELTHFQPGEVAFLVTHKGSSLTEKDYVLLRDWMTVKANESGLRLVLLQEAGFSFPAVEAEKMGWPIIKYSEDSQYLSPQFENTQPFTLLLAEVSKPKGKSENMPRSQLAEFISRLDSSRQELALSDGTTLATISPNWLASSTKDWGGTGGPGSRPSPYRGKLPPDYKIHIPGIEKLLELPEENRGEGVVVAILDTAPTPKDLERAKTYWSDTQLRDLAEALLPPHGRLQIHYASAADRARMSHVHLRAHPYRMPDHGLFVAGIIHSLAPAAEIHLFEVLNEYGVGDMATIGQGLKNTLSVRGNQYLVVNCSLVLNLPPYDPSAPMRLTRKLRGFNPVTGLQGEMLRAWSENQVLLLRLACQNIYQTGSRVVAAAGNDRNGEFRPQADYPAAFESVVGVGALQKGTLDPTSYSNFSDRPQTTGIITLGGESGEENGVLGIYLGQFPPLPSASQPSANKNGWAWWAGTSFASPIVTGLVAALLSTCQYATTEDAIRALYAANIFERAASSSEDALMVKQG